MYLNNYHYIVHRHCNVNMFCFINKNFISFCLTCRKWCTILKCNICIFSFIYCYISSNWNTCIIIIAKTWFNSFCIKFDRIVFVVSISCCLTVHDIPIFAANLDSSLLQSLKNLWSFLFPFYIILTALCEKLKVVSSVFSRKKNIVAPSFLSSLPIKLIYFIVSASSNSICLSKSISL